PYSHPFLGLSNGLNTKQGGVAGAVGGWVELGRTTLGSAGDNITVSSLADKRYYMVLGDFYKTGSAMNALLRLNNDTGNNYAIRWSDNGGGDGTGVSKNFALLGDGSGSTLYDQFAVAYIANLSNKEKLVISQGTRPNGTGAGNAPTRREGVSKWANTSATINRIDAWNPDAGSFDTGSEVVVLGWDPADTHTNNFWEELASVELGSAGDNLSTGTFTAKKYLWVQIFAKDNGSAIDLSATFNNDTGSNYAVRRSLNGAADGTFGNLTNMSWFGDNQAYNQFANVFIINNASNEKLCMCHWVGQGTAGAGNAPARSERATKWANTSNQITEIDIDNTSAGSFDTGSIIKVWGAD
ncbi:MAG: hypothetical protein ACPGSG_08260, partial [Prolixibacteraceae bacterium]